LPVSSAPQAPVAKAEKFWPQVPLTGSDRYLKNDHFRGRVALLIDQHPDAEPGSTLTLRSVRPRSWSDNPDRPVRAAAPGGLDTLRVRIDLERGSYQPVCRNSDNLNRLVLARGALEVSPEGVRQGHFEQTLCLPPERFLPALAESCSSEKNGESACAGKSVSKEFEMGRLVVTNLGRRCPDTEEHHVVLHDSLGGRLFIHSVRDVDAFEFDSDSDGVKDLFVASYDDCGGYLRLFRISPEAGAR